MYPRGHAGSSLLFNLPLLVYLTDDIIIGVICTLIIMWVSIIPDIDISNRLFLDKIEHRGFTHTIEFIILSSIIFNLAVFGINIVFQINSVSHVYVSLSVFIGLLSHTIIDTLDSHGVKISYFFSDSNSCVNLIKNNSSPILNNSIFIIGLLLTVTAIYTEYLIFLI